jgi:hypothetical protein
MYTFATKENPGYNRREPSSFPTGQLLPEELQSDSS